MMLVLFDAGDGLVTEGNVLSLVIHKQLILPCVQMVCASKALVNLEDTGGITNVRHSIVPVFGYSYLIFWLFQEF